MTSTEIHAMADQELDVAIFRELWTDGWKPDQPFCVSLDACHEAEKRLAETGLKVKFVLAFELVAHNAWCRNPSKRMGFRWCKYHAPARERAEAILLAIQEA